MTDHTPPDPIPVAWLKPIPAGYEIPIWRWILLPATTIMLKRSGGVWINGTLELTATDLRFTQAKAIKLSRASAPADAWSLPISAIMRAEISKGIASETIEIAYAGGVHKLMTARADSFINRLRQVVPTT